jgi:HD-like signal output (HDOD) protein
MTDEILKRIKQLPPLPETAMQIEQVYQDPNSNFQDMVKIIEKDPLLTADILKAANSPLYGFSREINSISQAVGLFGMGTVRGFALASIVKKSFALDLSPYGLNNAAFAELSKKEHALTTAWCLKKENRLMGVLSPAAFLVEIGKVIIAQVITSDGKEADFKNAIEELHGDTDAAELETVDVATPEVSAKIFEHWRFEENLVDVIKSSTSPQSASNNENKRAAAILQVVRTTIAYNGNVTDERIEKAKKLIDEYGLDLESFENALEGVK